MTLELIKIEVGPWPMNSYVVKDHITKEAAIIDPGAEGKKIIKAVDGYIVKFILITHGHGDHVSALRVVREETKALVCAHSEDNSRFDLGADLILMDGDTLGIGDHSVKVIHIPGHTAGQLCYDLLDGRIVSGDTIFAGGPGKTWSAEDFELSMMNLNEIVFNWPDETRFFPGHGPSSTIGVERPGYESFVERGWKKRLFGDVTWK